MTRRFTIKKEMRSLGIDLCRPGRIIGAVVRGGLYLDGVIIFSANPRWFNFSIANEILRTRFYPELKLIMTHDPKQRLKIKQIEKTTGLASIEVRTPHETRTKGFESFKIGSRELLAKNTLDSKIVQEIIARTWTTGTLPEPLRVAHLIAMSRFKRGKPANLGLTDKFGS